MSKDKHFERRMIVSKYSNRPPFDLKKPKETYDISDKIKEYPVYECKNCCQNQTNISRKPSSRSHKNMVIENVEEINNVSPKKRVIPKVLEIFRKLNSSREEEELTMSKNTSIETLYRNTGTYKLGKNIPKHKLMKSLLQNLDSEFDSSKKSSTGTRSNKDRLTPPKGKLKQKKRPKKKQFFDTNEVIRTDFIVNCENKKILEFSSECCTNLDIKPSKIDKKTSTTGLVWPPASREVLQYIEPTRSRHQTTKTSCKKLTVDQQNVTKFRSIKKESSHAHASQLSSSSFLEEIPTKDVPQYQCTEPARSEKIIRKRVSTSYELRQKSLEDSTVNKKQTYPKNQPYIVKPEIIEEKPEDNLKNSSSDKVGKLKGRSFVQTQVEKLNKFLRHTRIPPPKLSRPPHFDGGYQKKVEDVRSFMGRGDYLRRGEGIQDYSDIMNTIRSNVPVMEQSDNYDSLGSDHDWTDSGPEINPEHVRFPKETKTAIDQSLSERKNRIALSKFTKFHDSNFRPAFPQREEQFEDVVYDYYEGYCPQNIQTDHNVSAPTKNQPYRNNRTIRNSGSAQTKKCVNVPCKKNLLCDKGDQHSGPCGYTHNSNKVIY